MQEDNQTPPQSPWSAPQQPQQPQVSGSIISPPPQKDGSKLKILFIILGILLLAGAAAAALYVWPGYLKSQPSQNTSQNTQNNGQETPAPAQPVIIYTEEVKTVEQDGRVWPTVNILRKVADGEPEVLASNVGKVGESPSSGFVLSPDKKKLAINLKSKLQVLNLEDKKLTDVLTPKYAVQSLSFSHDSSKLVVWDQEYIDSRDYQVVQVDLSDSSQNVLLSGKTPDDYRYGFNLLAWRSDNVVIMAKTTGSEFTAPYYIDTNAKKILQTPDSSGVSYVVPSNNGELIAYPNGNANDTCDVVGGRSINNLSLRDPVTGSQVSEIKSSDSWIDDVLFSPDSKEVLYSLTPVGGNTKDKSCAVLSASKTFHKMTLSSKASQEVDDPQEVLKEWRSRTLLASVASTSATNHTIVFDGETVVTSSKQLAIAAQYYQ